MKPGPEITTTKADGFCFAPATIPAGETASIPVICNGWVPVGIITPADLAGAANVSFSADAGDGVYRPTYDREGNADAIILTADAFIKLAPTDYPGFASIVVNADAAPTADLELQVMLRSIND